MERASKPQESEGYRVILESGRIAEMATLWEELEPREIVAAALDLFGDRITIASSFGLEDVALIHMATSVAKGPIDVFCLDTEVLFPETYALMNRFSESYAIRLRRVVPEFSLAQQIERYGEELWARDPDQCCKLRKVEPLGRALQGYDAWVTGLRRAQGPTRQNAKAVEPDARHGLTKVNPLVRWSDEQLWAYVRAEEVPYNPLHERGYPSIGCIHCTRAVSPGEDPRAGRWAGFAKTECGLHL